MKDIINIANPSNPVFMLYEAVIYAAADAMIDEIVAEKNTQLSEQILSLKTMIASLVSDLGGTTTITNDDLEVLTGCNLLISKSPDGDCLLQVIKSN